MLPSAKRHTNATMSHHMSTPTSLNMEANVVGNTPLQSQGGFQSCTINTEALPEFQVGTSKA